VFIAANYRSFSLSGNRKMNGFSNLRFVAPWVIGAVCFLWTGRASIADNSWINLLGEDSRELWRGYKGETWPAGWELCDGVLSRTAGGDDLMTKAVYNDFDLRLEWKISPGGNSGVMYHVSTGDDAPYYTGPEYQILDNQGHPDGGKSETSAGSLYALYSPPKDFTCPVGRWNTARIVVCGNRVEHWLNGHKVVDCRVGNDDWNQRVAKSKFADWPKFAQNHEGYIVLQDHDAPVWFRNIFIRDLSKKRSPSAVGVGGRRKLN
jgi:3-keto-disaccharide hydrolase